MKYWDCLNVPGQHVSVLPPIDLSTPHMVLPPYPDYDGDTIPIEVDSSELLPADESTTENTETPYERSMRIAEEIQKNQLGVEANEGYPPLQEDIPTEPEIALDNATNKTIMSPAANKVISYMSELAKQAEIPMPESLEKTELDDDQAGEVMGTLLKYHKEYFSDIPLKEVHDKRFVFNIPKSVYDAHIKNEDYMRAPCLDPLFWFYLFCTEDPYDSIGAFISQIMSLIEDYPDWYSDICFSLHEYNIANHENPDDEEEIDESELAGVDEDDEIPETDVNEDSE